MKKILLLAALAILPGVLATPAQAGNVVSPAQDILIPPAKNGVDQFGVFYRGNVAAWSKNSTCQLMVSGKGIVTRLEAMGQASDSVALFDSSAVGSLSAASPDTTKLIAKLTVDTAKVSGDYVFRPGLPYVNGVVACPSSATSEGAVHFLKQNQ